MGARERERERERGGGVKLNEGGMSRIETAR